jgi:hypothetical protein
MPFGPSSCFLDSLIEKGNLRVHAKAGKLKGQLTPISMHCVVEV